SDRRSRRLPGEEGRLEPGERLVFLVGEGVQLAGMKPQIHPLPLLQALLFLHVTVNEFGRFPILSPDGDLPPAPAGTHVKILITEPQLFGALGTVLATGGCRNQAARGREGQHPEQPKGERPSYAAHRTLPGKLAVKFSSFVRRPAPPGIQTDSWPA